MSDVLCSAMPLSNSEFRFSSVTVELRCWNVYSAPFVAGIYTLRAFRVRQVLSEFLENHNKVIILYFRCCQRTRFL